MRVHRALKQALDCLDRIYRRLSFRREDLIRQIAPLPQQAHLLNLGGQVNLNGGNIGDPVLQSFQQSLSFIMFLQDLADVDVFLRHYFNPLFVLFVLLAEVFVFVFKAEVGDDLRQILQHLSLYFCTIAECLNPSNHHLRELSYFLKCLYVLEFDLEVRQHP